MKFEFSDKADFTPEENKYNIDFEDVGENEYTTAYRTETKFGGIREEDYESYMMLWSWKTGSSLSWEIRENGDHPETIRLKDQFENIVSKYGKNFNNLILLRGFKKYMEMNVGDVIHDKGIMAKTYDFPMSVIFSGNEAPCIGIFYYPGNSKHLYVSDILGSSEEEFLTYPGEKFKVIAKKRMEVITEDGPQDTEFFLFEHLGYE